MLAAGLQRFGPAFWDLALSAMIWLGAIALAMVACRQPGRRRDLARLGLLGALALFPLAGLLNTFRGHPATPFRAWITLIPAPMPVTSASFSFQGDELPLPGLIGPLMWLYLAGLAVGMAGLMLGAWATRWLLRNTSEPLPAVQALYEQLAEESSQSRRPALRVSEKVGRPVLAGVSRPTILIPPELQNPEAADPLRLALLHELAHAERFDPLFWFLGRLAQSFWFFLPPLWWIRHQLRLDQEFLADRQAASRFGAQKDYASSLVDMSQASALDASSGIKQKASTSASPGLAIGSPLFQRVLMLLRCPFPVESHPPAWWRWLFLPILLGSLLLLVLVSPGNIVALMATTTQEPETDIPTSGSFYLEELKLAPRPGLAEPYWLPLSTPRWFELTVEILAEEETLAKMRLLGLPLQFEKAKEAKSARPMSPPDSQGSTTTQELNWRVVRLCRAADGLGLWVDGTSIPIDPDFELTPWLSIHPVPEQPCQVRDLRVHW